MKAGDGDWAELNDAPIRELHHKVPRLKEGGDYKFRVKAVNAAGPGDTSRATSSVTAEKQPRMFYIVIIIFNMMTLSYGLPS